MFSNKKNTSRARAPHTAHTTGTEYERAARRYYRIAVRATTTKRVRDGTRMLPARKPPPLDWSPARRRERARGVAVPTHTHTHNSTTRAVQSRESHGQSKFDCFGLWTCVRSRPSLRTKSIVFFFFFFSLVIFYYYYSADPRFPCFCRAVAPRTRRTPRARAERSFAVPRSENRFSLPSADDSAASDDDEQWRTTVKMAPCSRGRPAPAIPAERSSTTTRERAPAAATGRQLPGRRRRLITLSGSTSRHGPQHRRPSSGPRSAAQRLRTASI